MSDSNQGAYFCDTNLIQYNDGRKVSQVNHDLDTEVVLQYTKNELYSRKLQIKVLRLFP